MASDGPNGCATCRIGAASGVGQGGRCPMVDRRRQAGATLYAAGEPAEKVLFLKQGTVLLSRDADEAGGEGVAWAVRRPGAILGIEGLVRGTYLDSARAVTDVTVCGASRAEIQAWLGAREIAARTVLECVLVTLATDSPRRAGADGNARQRVATWILDQAAGEAATLPRNVVADLLGMLPETLSRALASLAETGAITVSRRSIEVRDVAALEAIATQKAARAVAHARPPSRAQARG